MYIIRLKLEISKSRTLMSRYQFFFKYPPANFPATQIKKYINRKMSGTVGRMRFIDPKYKNLEISDWLEESSIVNRYSTLCIRYA